MQETKDASFGEVPGTFLGVTTDGLRVLCGEGSVLEITELQKSSRKRVNGHDFANGEHLSPGDLIFSH